MDHSCESTSNMDSTRMGLVSLDEVFVSKSQTPIAGQDKLRLTPLSKKACLVHGIDPKALIQREYASFCSVGQDPEITTMKYEMYTRTRDKLYNIASEERQKLLAAQKAKDDSFTSTNDSVSTPYSKTYSMANSSLDRKEREISTLIENEKRRLEKVANRQQKELMRMLSFEQKSKEIMDKMRAKTEEQKRKELQQKKEKRKRDLQAAEEARLRELRRKAREDAEVAVQRMKMQEQFERDRVIREKKLREEREIKKRALIEEQERIKRKEEHMRQTQNIYKQQRLETTKKMREREAKEREKNEKLELRRLVDAQAAEQKRKETQQRIESNLRAARQAQESKRSELLLKQQRHEEFMDQIAREKEAEMAERKQLNEVMDSKRRAQLNKTKKEEEEIKKTVRSKIEQEEQHLRELTAHRRKEQMLIKAERDLQLQMKKDNLERIKRAQEYRQRELLRKADEDDRRCQEMKEKKESLLKLRQKNVAMAKLKKDKLMEALESSKSGGSNAIKKLLAGVLKENAAASAHDKNDDEEQYCPSDEREAFDTNTPSKNVHVSEDYFSINEIAISPIGD